MRPIRILLIVLFAGLPTFCQGQVAARRISEAGVWGPWRNYSVRSVREFASLPDVPLDRFGGRSDRSGIRTGFFHTQKIDGRWWLVDPDGHLYLHNAIAVVRAPQDPESVAALTAQFGDPKVWPSAATAQLLANGNNGLGAWSDPGHLRNPDHSLPYIVNLDVMAAFEARKRGPGGTVMSPISHEETVSVFDPAFPAFAATYLKRIEKERSDPSLLGYFSDNELPFWHENLDILLRKPVSDPGRLAAKAWLRDRHASVPTDGLRVAFLEYEATVYGRIMALALHTADPNHLYLGYRLFDRQNEMPELFRAAGRYADVLSLNFYNTWAPSSAAMRAWTGESGKPFLIAEFYVKGADSGMGNRSGAGWEVRTQADRGAFYQNFVLALLASGNCIGWDWFKYRDNDPNDPNAEPSNRDANKGIVSLSYQPYQRLLNAMSELNRQMYALADRLELGTLQSGSLSH